MGNGQWVYNDPSYINFVKTSNSDGSPIGVAYIQGMNVNLRSGPSTTSAVIRQLNSPESYLVYINENGWLNLGEISGYIMTQRILSILNIRN